MLLVRDFTSCPESAKDAFVALGNFDGVHRGHRAILETTVRLAHAAKKPAAVMTFEPHPREFFARTQTPFHIYPLQRKLRLLRQCGIDIVYLARFNATLAATSAQDFVDRILVGELDVRHVITGHNFAFGKGRQGNTEFLDRAICAQGRSYTAINPVHDAHRNTISSSAVRDALAQGEMASACALLGAPYQIQGRVRRGDRRGRTIGFPTANLSLGKLCRPRFGVYTARAYINASVFSCVVNIGLRPTFSASEPLLEAHIFDFGADIYGKKVAIEPIAFIRDEQKFEGIEALKTQIMRDCETAKAMLRA